MSGGRATSAARAITRRTLIPVLTIMASAVAGALLPAVASAAETPLCAAPWQGGSATYADPSNPLGLSPAPGSDPLTGTSFYLSGPGYGHAAGAIAQLLKDNGLSTMSPSDYGVEPWSTFKASIQPTLSSLASSNPGLYQKITLLERIADQPETARFSMYTAGGTPDGIYSNVQKYLCRIESPAATQGVAPQGATVPNQPSLPIISTYFLPKPEPCNEPGLTPTQVSTFDQQVKAFADGLQGYSAVVLDEIDAIDTSLCLSRTGLLERLQMLRTMVVTIHNEDPHVVQYVEGGANDAECVAYAVAALKYIDGTSSLLPSPTVCPGKTPPAPKKHAASKHKTAKKHHRKKPASDVRAAEAAAGLPLRGFYLGDTHFSWTLDEIEFGYKVAMATGLHFIVTTQDNGHGSIPGPGGTVAGGNEWLCNPANAGLGPTPTANTGYAAYGVDAFEWSGTPGLSGGTGPNCNGVTTPPGLFDMGFALQLASRATNLLSPTVHASEPVAS